MTGQYDGRLQMSDNKAANKDRPPAKSFYNDMDAI